ncbi:MAG TPA: alpha/beta hydrolase [Polyangiaceae bacterium]|jgi:dienelactone hydrolase|nr:alpha/beta hydrolase [Polyangiaceae bacterium]
MVREKIYTFGPSQALVGILTEPESSAARPGAPVIVASNVGLNHRVGPFRTYVELSRRLARAGYSMLRFDLSGLGDSQQRKDAKTELERGVLDVKDAMTALAERNGTKRFIQLGFCSGVDSAHTVTVDDPRVAGAIFVEGYSFQTKEFLLRRYLKRPLSRRFWELYARRTIQKHAPQLMSELREAGDGVEIYTRNYPTKERLESEFQKVTGRGTNLLFVYSGGYGSDAANNYIEQFGDTFPSLRDNAHIEVEYYERADHTYTVLFDREKLMQRIERWMLRYF